MPEFKLGRRHALSAAASGLLWGRTAVAAERQHVLRLADAQIGQADPHKAVDFPASILMFNLYDFLVRPLPGAKLGAGLAESWTISPDGIAYTFHIRDGVHFHDGGLLTAKDVVFSATRMIAMKRGYSYLFQGVKSVQQTGPSEVVFTLERPFAPFLAALVRLAIISGDRVMANKQPGSYGEFGDYGDAFLTTNDAGSGPYRIVTHNPQVETVMEKFPGYYGEHAPNSPDVVRSKFGVEAATVRALMPRREIELTRLPLAPEVLQALARSPGIGLGEDRTPGLYNFHLNMQKAPTDDVNFRKALALAFDYEQVYAMLAIAGHSSGVPVRGPVPSGVMGYDPDVAPLKRDVAAAKAALAQSKYATNPPPIDLVWNNATAIQQKFALLFQSNMAELGITVNIVPAPWPQIVQMATTPASTPHVACVSVSMSTSDIDSLLWAEYHSSAGGTYYSMPWFSSKEVDAALEKARILLDPAERDRVYRDAAAIIREQYPSLYLFQGNTIVAYQKYLNAPGLIDESKSIPVMAANYQYAQMSMSD